MRPGVQPFLNLMMHFFYKNMPGDDEISAGAGNDDISAGAGDDGISAGAGNDDLNRAGSGGGDDNKPRTSEEENNNRNDGGSAKDEEGSGSGSSREIKNRNLSGEDKGSGVGNDYGELKPSNVTVGGKKAGKNRMYTPGRKTKRRGREKPIRGKMGGEDEGYGYYDGGPFMPGIKMIISSKKL